MIYHKASQPVPGKGEALMFYECNDDESIRRYLTYIPATQEIDCVPKPFIKKLQRPEMLMPSSKEEFYQYWTGDGDDDDGGGTSATELLREAAGDSDLGKGLYFNGDMTIGEAMAIHPQVSEVFAAFHLGGCSSCGVSEFETISQVCMGYGIEVETLLDVLDGLMKTQETAKADESPAAVES